MIEHLCCFIGLIDTGDIQILTVCLLQSQSPVSIVSASYIPNLPSVLTYHFLGSKSNSCTQISLPTLQIYLLYSHITSYAPNLTPVLTYHFLLSKSPFCTHISLSLLQMYFLHAHASTPILKWQFILGYSRRAFP